MVKKETIGKIQLVAGIILLLISLTGIIIALNNYNDIVNLFKLNFGSYNNPVQSLAVIYLKFDIAVTSIILFIISLLFITQGLVNTSRDK
ncbi:MAG: hypothetical protein AABY15_06320 [Nanoarchaeota archaeon]